MTRPTGRPRGRPKTKEYVTLMARVDATLADQVKRYAALHRQPPDSASFDELLSDRNQAAIAIIDADARSDREYLSDTNKDEDILSDTKEDKTILSDTNRDTEILSDAKAVPVIVSDTKADDVDFNPTTHSLGKLCPRQHNYRGTGQSVLRISNRHCRACDREKFHERKQAKRQAAHA